MQRTAPLKCTHAVCAIGNFQQRLRQLYGLQGCIPGKSPLDHLHRKPVHLFRNSNAFRISGVCGQRCILVEQPVSIITVEIDRSGLQVIICVRNIRQVVEEFPAAFIVDIRRMVLG